MKSAWSTVLKFAYDKRMTLSYAVDKTFTTEQTSDILGLQDFVKFAVPLDVMYFANDKYKKLIKQEELIGQMFETELLRLPFPNVLIEMEHTLGDRTFVAISETATYGMFKFKLLYYKKSQNIVISIFKEAHLKILKDGSESFQYALNTGPENNQKSNFASISSAFCFLMFILQTKGVKQSQQRLKLTNKIKRKTGNSNIRNNITKVELFSYVDESGNEQRITKNSPVIHWRCGHFRTVHYGINRSMSKKKYIYPCLVGFKSKDTIPKVKPRHVVN